VSSETAGTMTPEKRKKSLQSNNPRNNFHPLISEKNFPLASNIAKHWKVEIKSKRIVGALLSRHTNYSHISSNKIFSEINPQNPSA
jgi:hypothetical protein